MNEQAGVIGGLDQGALEELSFGRVEQCMRSEDPVEVLRDVSLTGHHADRVGAGRRLQGMSRGRVCCTRDIVDDAGRHSPFRDGVVRLAGQ